MRGVVLLLAAGGGNRLGRGPKAFVELCGVSLLRRAAEAAARAELVDRIVAAVPAGTEEAASVLLQGIRVPFDVAPGGETRQASASSAAEVATGAEAICVHDAARALCPSRLFDTCLLALDDAEAAIVALPVSDTVKEVSGTDVVRTIDRARLASAQTPQAFRTRTYLEALEAAGREGLVASDDAAIVERLGVRVRILPGDERNIKITSEVDLLIAEALLKSP